MKCQGSLFEFDVVRSVRPNTLPTTDSTDEDEKAQDNATEPTTAACGNSDSSALHDIGRFVGDSCAVVPDETKHALLRDCWVPPDDYVFPFVHEAGKNRKFQRSWLKRFLWLSYTNVLHGAVCKYCVIFAPVDVRNQELKRLVTMPLTRFKDAIEICASHEATSYHKDSMMRAEAFLAAWNDPSKDIRNAMDVARQKQVEENRARIIPVIKTVLFCGRQELPLRGHRDCGPLLENPTENDGVFRAALQFRLDAGDKDLERHLSTAHANATYLSWQSQNDIIQACGTIIAAKISKEVEKARFYSIIVDETTDAATKEQCSLSVRYLKEDTISERFVALCDVNGDMSAKSIAASVLQTLKDSGFDATLIRGQGYDGASTMSGKFNGVQAEIKKASPSAPYVHCASHVLNLAVQKASDVAAVRNAFGVIKGIATFFNFSAKRTASLQATIRSCQLQKHKVKNVCPTRWVEGHKAVIRFAELYPAIFETLEELAADSGDTSCQAALLLKGIANFDFVIALHVMDETSGLLLPLSKALQSSTFDRSKGWNLVQDVLGVLKQRRGSAEEQFTSIFQKASVLAEQHEIEVKVPRRAGRQIHRTDVTATCPEEYYRICVYVAFTDTLLLQLTHRFRPHDALCLRIQKILPAFVSEAKFEDLHDVLEFYRKDIGPDSVIRGEFERWKLLWSNNVTHRTSTAHEALIQCDRQLFPQLHTLLRLFVTLPLTSASAERSFSTLRRLKSYLRSTMNQERINGLAHLCINRDIAVEPQEVIQELVKKQRRLNFVL